jgi:hypothetical protein
MYQADSVSPHPKKETKKEEKKERKKEGRKERERKNMIKYASH